ncbi:MAG TPA: sugar phosphate isomerase/epimerase [Anaerolineae bacterium]|jgi:sugar phosphate isomerase/epimerase
MSLSITTDFARDTGSPEPYLREIAEAGFSHIHWCHHWNTDFLYSPAEINQIGAWLYAMRLQLLDIHASDGKEKNWTSVLEYERLAGVDLVRNRIDMAAAMGADAVVMHVPDFSDPASSDPRWTQLRKSLDILEDYASARHVRIAIENGSDNSMATIERLYGLYDPSFLGMCYDCGHGNLTGHGLDQLEPLKVRLYVVHLHDNDGTGDQHNIPFTGTVDWPRLTRLLATSSYKKPISMESNIHRSGITDEREFLNKAFQAGTRLTEMVAAA